MINAQKWLNENYPNKEETKHIELEEGMLITGQLQIENFPCLEKINLKGNWDQWGKLTRLTVKKCPVLKELNCSYNEIKEFTVTDCPQLQNFDYSRNNQWEELAKFDGSKLDYDVVSYIGILDDDLYQQLKAGLPGSKHEDYRRLCLGCLTEGGHKNILSYNYYGEAKLTKGGTIEYAVTANGNKRQTCEIPEEGGLLVVNINSTESGTLKIKRNEIRNLEKLSEEDEKTKLVKTIQELEDNLKRKEVKDNEQWTKQLEEGKDDLKKKLLEVEKKLSESEKQRQELQFEYDSLKRTLHGKKTEIDELKRVKDADQQKFARQIEELEKEKELTENETKILQKLKELFSIFNNQLDSENIVKLKKTLQDYKEADFTSTPHLPDIFRLGDESLSDYLDSSLQHYHEWQRARKEAEELRTNIKQEESKNAEKIAELSQKVKELQSQNEAQQPEEIIILQGQLKQAQDYAQELKNTLKITVQTLEKEIQTDLTSEDINQKDLKIEEFKQQLTKQKRLSIKSKPVNPSLGDSSWANLVQSPTESGSLSPSQIKARERQIKQEQITQIQTNLPPKTPK